MSATTPPLSHVTAGDPDGPTLVLLHGIMGSAISASGAIEHWAERGYRVIALDARGHGLSPRWDDTLLPDAGDQLVTDVVTFLARDLEARRAQRAAGMPTDTRPALVVGHSMGGATAMVVALRHPDLVSGAVLCDPARYGQRTQAQLLARGAGRARTWARETADLPAAVARALQDPDIPESEAVAGVWATQRTDTRLLTTGVVAPPVPWAQAMAALTVPTLVVTGDRPGSARVGHEGARLLRKQANPNVEVVILPGAGHDVRRTREHDFYAAVDPWLEEHHPA